MIKMIIENKNDTQDVSDIVFSCKLDTELNKASVFKFDILKVDGLAFFEGNRVTFYYKNHLKFVGYVFEKSVDKEKVISVTCYDLLTYFARNKDTYDFKDSTASEIISKMAFDFGLRNEIVDTEYKIAKMKELDQNLLDICKKALDYTLIYGNKYYFINGQYDVLKLCDIEDFRTNITLDTTTNIKNYQLTTSINDKVYNQIKLYRENENTNERTGYMAWDMKKIDEWGILQLYEKADDNLSEAEILAKAETLLTNYSSKTRVLKLEIEGNIELDSGNSVFINLGGVSDVNVAQTFIIKSCKHTFDEVYTQSLELLGEIKNV